MNRYGRISIDGRDGWDDFGILVLKSGFDDWLKFPDMKERFSHDWKDEDGTEFDTEQAYIKEQNVSLRFVFIADSKEQFWKNYEELQGVLTQPGIRTIYFSEMETKFDVLYTKCDKVSKFTRLKNTNKIVVEMTVSFVIPNFTPAGDEGIEFWAIEEDFIVS